MSRRIDSRLVLALILSASAGLPYFLATADAQEKTAEQSKELLAELKNYRHKLVYESNRDGNFELYLCNADGSHRQL